MRFKLPGAALAVAVLSAWAIAAPAQADNYQVRDGTGVAQTFCSRVFGALHFPCHMMFGISGSTPTPITVDPEGRVNVNLQSSPLPSGAATSTKQDAGNATLTSIDTKMGAQSTLEAQNTGNASLATVATNTGATATQSTAIAANLGAVADGVWGGSGSGTMIAIDKYIAGKVEAMRALQATGNSSLVNIDADLGGSSDTTCSTDAGTCSITALLKRNNERLSSILGATLSVNCITGCSGGGGGGGGTEYAEDAVHASGDFGQVMLGVRKDAAASLAGADGDYTAPIFASDGSLWARLTNTSMAVTGTFWQATQPISAAALPLPSGAATAANQATGNTSLGNVDADLGAPGDATCATDTGTCSLTALAKRANERLTSLLTDATPVKTNLTAATTGGCTPALYRSLATNNSTLIATGARTLCKLVLLNTSATIYYARFYDLAAAPTCSSGTGEVAAYVIPASTTGAGVAVPLGPFGEAYASGLGFCITAGNAANDNTNAASGVTLAYSYK